MGIVNGKAVTALFCVVFLSGVLACGGSGGSNPTTTTSFSGAIAGSDDTNGQSGVISVTVKPVTAAETAQISSTMTSTGTLTLADGTTITLTGTYDSSAGTLTLTGDGGYTFTGTLDSNLMSGDYASTGDNTGGGFAGLNSTANTVKVFCGTFIHGSDDSSGLFNLVVTATTVSGVRINYSSKTTYKTLSGTRTGDTLDIVVDDNGRKGNGLITGDTVAGTFINKQGNQGTFTGSVAECQSHTD